MESDLHPVSRKKEMFKYADDTNLLVPQHTDATLHIEFNILNGHKGIKWH
jgi:hypothetical protein